MHRLHLFDGDDDAAVGDEVKGTVVVDFADEVDDVAFRVGGNANGGYRLVRLVNRHFRPAYLRLLPPKEGEAVAIRVEGFRGVQTEGDHCPFLDLLWDNDGDRVVGQYNIRIKIAAALGGPLHTGAEVVELVRIEAPFVGDADTA